MSVREDGKPEQVMHESVRTFCVMNNFIYGSEYNNNSLVPTYDNQLLFIYNRINVSKKSVWHRETISILSIYSSHNRSLLLAHQKFDRKMYLFLVRYVNEITLV
jgi:hypothetical protein